MISACTSAFLVVEKRIPEIKSASAIDMAFCGRFRFGQASEKCPPDVHDGNPSRCISAEGRESHHCY
jgi:hypothetical protein